MVKRAVAIACVVGAVSAAGCSGSDDGPAFGGRSAFEERLGLIPASLIEPDEDGPGVTIAMADLDRAAELAGVARPEDVTDQEAVAAYVGGITGFRPQGEEEPSPVAALLPEVSQYQRATTRLDEFAEEVGWSLVDVSWFVEYQVRPGVFTVMGGDFDEDRLSEAMGEPQDDIWSLGGEDGTSHLDDVSVARPIGESLRLALDGDRLIVGRTTPPVADALDGDGETLADDPVLGSLAEALDAESAYSALLMSGRAFDLSSSLRDAPPEAVSQAEDQVLPEAFTGVAIGLTHEDDQAVAVFVYTHDDEAAAKANREALQRLVADGMSLQTRQPWSELFTVDEVRTDGTTVVARLAIPRERPAIQAYRVALNRDALVTHV